MGCVSSSPVTAIEHAQPASPSKPALKDAPSSSVPSSGEQEINNLHSVVGVADSASAHINSDSSCSAVPHPSTLFPSPHLPMQNEDSASSVVGNHPSSAFSASGSSMLAASSSNNDDGPSSSSSIASHRAQFLFRQASLNSTAPLRTLDISSVPRRPRLRGDGSGSELQSELDPSNCSASSALPSPRLEDNGHRRFTPTTPTTPSQSQSQALSLQSHSVPVSRGSSLVTAYFHPTVVPSDSAARIVAALTMIAAVDDAVDAAKASAAAADAPAPFLLRRQSETLSRTSSINSVAAPPPRAHTGGRLAQIYSSAHDGSDSDEDEFDKATAAALEAIERKAAAAAAAKARPPLSAQQPHDLRRALSGASAHSSQTAFSVAVAGDTDGLFVASEHEHRIMRIRSTDRESREPTPSTPALLRRVSDSLRTIEEGVALTQQKLHMDASSFVSPSSLSHSASHSGLTSLTNPAASHSESAAALSDSSAAGSPQPALQPRPPAHARPPSLSRASTLGRRGNAANVSVLPSLAEGVEPPTASAKPVQLSSPVASPAAMQKPPASMRAVSMSIVA